MGINLSKKQEGDGINLTKNQVINLKKPSPDSPIFDLSKITIGMGWDVTGGRKFDLDASCMLLNKDGKLESDDLVSYMDKKHRSGKVWSTGDNTTGEGDGDDEQIVAQLESLDAKYQKLVFFVNIYEGKNRGQRFSDIANAYCRAMDANGKEIFRFVISNNPDLNNKYSFIFAEVYRGANGWELKALGEAHETDAISGITEKYKAKSGFFSR